MLEWWKTQSKEDKMRLVIPLMRMSIGIREDKLARKGGWELISNEELEKLIALIRELHTESNKFPRN